MKRAATVAAFLLIFAELALAQSATIQNEVELVVVKLERLTRIQPGGSAVPVEAGPGKEFVKIHFTVRFLPSFSGGFCDIRPGEYELTDATGSKVLGVTIDSTLESNTEWTKRCGKFAVEFQQTPAGVALTTLRLKGAEIDISKTSGAGPPKGQAPQTATQPFGKTVVLKPGVSVTVKRQDIEELRQRYPSEFAGGVVNLAAFEFAIHSADEAELVLFKTDRENAIRSDVVVLCKDERVNIDRMGGVRADNPSAYTFGPPGAYQAKTDGMWRSMTIGSKSFLVFFDLPPTCTREVQQLLAGLTVTIEGKDSLVHLRFADAPSR